MPLLSLIRKAATVSGRRAVESGAELLVRALRLDHLSLVAEAEHPAGKFDRAANLHGELDAALPGHPSAHRQRYVHRPGLLLWAPRHARPGTMPRPERDDQQHE